ncbi:hypothetical protein EMGBS15_02740 [Filimonas sp.]|nr:hypothetical protein EMGBS15_02740 [Filimonas sp.]
MKKAVVTRNYSFADATLITTCNNTHHFMSRDTTEFGTFNVLPADMTTFRTEVTTFEDLPTDQELLGAQIEATEKKDLIAENLKVAIREIMTRAQSKYGVHGARYKKFGTEDMDSMDDPHLLTCGRRVKRIATEFSAELATKGLTAAMITALNTLNQDYEDALDKKVMPSPHAISPPKTASKWEMPCTKNFPTIAISAKPSGSPKTKPSITIM